MAPTGGTGRAMAALECHLEGHLTLPFHHRPAVLPPTHTDFVSHRFLSFSKSRNYILTIAYIYIICQGDKSLVFIGFYYNKKTSFVRAGQIRYLYADDFDGLAGRLT